MSWILNRELRWRWWTIRQQERAAFWLVWHLPRWTIYWAVIRCYAHGTMDQYGTTEPDSLGWNEALKRWAHHATPQAGEQEKP